VGDYECPPGMSVELESCLRFEHQGIEKAFDCKHVRDRVVRGQGVECRKAEESCWSVCCQVQKRYELLDSPAKSKYDCDGEDNYPGTSCC
jgi:hypothetical protein